MTNTAITTSDRPARDGGGESELRQALGEAARAVIAGTKPSPEDAVEALIRYTKRNGPLPVLTRGWSG